jgi:putative ABC transport system permease protein
MLTLLAKVSLPHLRASWGRTALVIGGTSTGVALIVAINVINVSIMANFRSSIKLVSGPAALEIALGTGEIGFPESSVDPVRDDADVAHAVPIVRGTVALADAPDVTLHLFGADLLAGSVLNQYEITLLTPRQLVVEAIATDPGALLIAQEFADERHLHLGDTVRITSPTGLKTLTVRGLLAPQGFGRAFGGRLVIMDLPAAQALLGKASRLDQLDVILTPDADIEAVRQRLASTLPSTLRVDRPLHRGLLYGRIISSFQALLSGLSLLCLVAGTYIIYNTTSTGALHRAFIIARLRVIGVSKHRMFGLLMSEALILGCIGTAVGISMGVGLARVLTGLVEETMGVVFQMRFALEELTFSLRDQAFIALLGVAATVFASHFAARRVSNLPPLDILRADLRSLTVHGASARLAVWWSILVALAALALWLEVRFRSSHWGNLASTLWFGSSIVIAIPLVTLSVPLLRRALPYAFGAEGTMAAESLGQSPTRCGVTVAAIALVLTVGILISGMARSHRESVRDQVLGGPLACDLAVSAVTTEGGWLETPMPGALRGEVARLPGVRRVESWRVLPGHLYEGSRIALVGISDGLIDPSRFPAGWYRAGDPAAAARSLQGRTGVVVSEAFADRFGRELGDIVELDTPTGVLELTVVGVMRDYVSDRGAIWLSANLLTTRWMDDTISWMMVFAMSPKELPVLRDRIARQLGNRYQLKVLSLADLDAYLADKIDRAYAFTLAIQLLAAVVTVAGIFDLLLAAIWERRRELALWQVIGATTHAVRRSVVIESVVIGLLGSILGVAVGLVTTIIWVQAHYRHLLGYYLELHFPFASTVWYVLLILVMTVAAGYAAARYATRQSILDGIQVE